jgi:hypothetical protein
MFDFNFLKLIEKYLFRQEFKSINDSKASLSKLNDMARQPSFPDIKKEQQRYPDLKISDSLVGFPSKAVSFDYPLTHLNPITAQLSNEINTGKSSLSISNHPESSTSRRETIQNNLRCYMPIDYQATGFETSQSTQSLANLPQLPRIDVIPDDKISNTKPGDNYRRQSSFDVFNALNRENQSDWSLSLELGLFFTDDVDDADDAFMKRASI